MSMFVQPHAGKITKSKARVICPNCDGIAAGEVESCENFPFASYYAHCHACGYDITESEWNEVKEQGRE